MLIKKTSPIKSRITTLQRELIAQKTVVKDDIHRIRCKSAERLSQPSTLAISFVSGMCAGLLTNSQTVRPLASEVVSSSVTLVRKLVIIPLLGQFLAKQFTGQYGNKTEN